MTWLAWLFLITTILFAWIAWGILTIVGGIFNHKNMSSKLDSIAKFPIDVFLYIITKLNK